MNTEDLPLREKHNRVCTREMIAACESVQYN